jgi:hypothetical protein
MAKIIHLKGQHHILERSFAINPKFANTYYYRGHCKILLGEKDFGCLDLSKAGELGDSAAYDAIKDFCN